LSEIDCALAKKADVAPLDVGSVVIREAARDVRKQ
jgi:hypothetical protein